MPRLASAVVAFPLMVAATPALAHGFEALMLSLALIGASVGFIGGAVAAAFRVKALVGLASSLALLFAGEMLIVLFDSGSYEWDDVGAMALWLALFAALPLIVVFLVAFAGLSVVRNRVWPTGAKSDPAP
jgi:hypothetical protein